MKTYYDKDGITIFHGDSRDVIPRIGRFDLMLTDPPYGVDGGKGQGRIRGKVAYEPQGWSDTPEYIKGHVIPVIEAALRKVDRAIITPGKTHMMHYPMPEDIGCFYVPAGPSRGPWGFTSFNPILYYGTDPRPGQRAGQWPTGKTLPHTPSVLHGHPCSKPIEIWQWLLAKGSVMDEDIILDPFMGAGTTLRAAKNLGRRAVGIEIEERYCAMAVEMLAQEVLPI